MTHTIDAEIPQESLPPKFRSLPFTNQAKSDTGASAAEAVKTSEVVCQLFFCFCR